MNGKRGWEKLRRNGVLSAPNPEKRERLRKGVYAPARSVASLVMETTWERLAEDMHVPLLADNGLDLSLLGDLQRVIHLDAQVSNRAFKLCVSK